MSPLSETYIEILSYLRDNPAGLNTRQILSTAQKKRCFILGNDQSTDKISSCAFHMRQKKLITSSDGKGGKIHKITELGLQRLNEFGLLSSDGATDTNEPDIASLNEVADEIIKDIQDEQNDNCAEADKRPELNKEDHKKSDLDVVVKKIDDAFNLIREARTLALCKMADQVTIRDKSLKLSVLERLVPLYNDEISGVLAAIRADLEQLEAD